MDQNGVIDPFSSQQKEQLISLMNFRRLPKSSSPIPLDVETECLYVQKGELYITMFHNDGREFRILTLREGDFCWVSRFTMPTSAQVGKSANIGFLPHSVFEVMVNQDPMLYRAALEWHQWVNKLVTLKIRDLLLFGKRGAVASTLVRLAASCGESVDDGIRLSRKISHDELSKCGCGSREYINRLLHDYKDRQVLSFNNRFIVIHDIETLKQDHDCLNCEVAFCRM